MPKRYPQDERERAARMVLDHLGEYDSVFAACSANGPKLNIGRESLRRWVLQAQVDADERLGVSSADQTRITELERENRELREANEILKKASIFFARELDPRRHKWPDSSTNCVLMATGSSRPARSRVSRACRSPRGPTGPGNPKHPPP